WLSLIFCVLFFFFFQAEDGIRDRTVTGVQTCALPISSRTTIFAARRVAPPDLIVPADASAPRMNETGPEAVPPEVRSSFEERMRSEERRVGKECRSRWAPGREKKKTQRNKDTRRVAHK